MLRIAKNNSYRRKPARSAIQNKLPVLIKQRPTRARPGSNLQVTCTALTLDSGFRRNDGKWESPAFIVTPDLIRGPVFMKLLVSYLLDNSGQPFLKSETRRLVVFSGVLISPDFLRTYDGKNIQSRW
jgi:hypothetical protein